MTADDPAGDTEVPIFDGATVHRHRLRWWRGSDYHIEVDGPRHRRTASGPDLFEALLSLRRDLEADGLLIGVEGARCDAYPSGMVRDMAGGERVYRLRKGRSADPADMMDTLAVIEDRDLIATVDEQLRHYRDWLSS